MRDLIINTPKKIKFECDLRDLAREEINRILIFKSGRAKWEDKKLRITIEEVQRSRRIKCSE